MLQEGPPAAASSPTPGADFVAPVEAFAYSSGLAAAVGGALTLAVGRALGSDSAWAASALVGSSVLFIYGVDRLRDVEDDRAGSPRRTDFVVRHRRRLGLASLLAGLCLACLLVLAPAAVFGLCAALGAVGLSHRRLKQSVPWKIGYVATAWTVACVGIPWLWSAVRPAAEPSIWAATLVGSSLVSNLIASNLREGKAERWHSLGRPEVAITAARFALVGSVLAVVAAPDSVTPLAWIPAGEALALAFFRPTERYGHLAVDGALLVGAILAAAQAAWTG